MAVSSCAGSCTRPSGACVRVDGSGFEVLNGLRHHRIPFGKVEDIEVRYSTDIWTKTGRDAIVAAWQDARFSGAASADGDVVSTWNLPTIIVGTFAILSVIIAAWV